MTSWTTCNGSWPAWTHDVGYPLEIASKVATPFGDKLNATAAELQMDVPKVRYRAPRLEGLEDLMGGRNGLSIIQDRLNEWGIAVDVKSVYQERTQEGAVCHGVISALAVLWVLDLLYARSNPGREYRPIVIDDVDWNQRWFETDNVSACSAIFLHNLDIRYFQRSRINRHRAPVAYLLRLADTLQEWDRPSGKIPNGLSADLFDVEAEGSEIIYRANVEDGMKQYLKRTLDATLEDHHIRIE